MELKLIELREQIDRIDEKLIKLLEQRFSLTESVGYYKKNEKLPVMQEGREQIILNKIRQEVIQDAYLPFIEAIFKSLLAESKQQQQLLMEREEENEK